MLKESKYFSVDINREKSSQCTRNSVTHYTIPFCLELTTNLLSINVKYFYCLQPFAKRLCEKCLSVLQLQLMFKCT